MTKWDQKVQPQNYLDCQPLADPRKLSLPILIPPNLFQPSVEANPTPNLPEPPWNLLTHSGSKSFCYWESGQTVYQSWDKEKWRILQELRHKRRWHCKQEVRLFATLTAPQIGRQKADLGKDKGKKYLYDHFGPNANLPRMWQWQSIREQGTLLALITQSTVVLLASPSCKRSLSCGVPFECIWW